MKKTFTNLTPFSGGETSDRRGKAVGETGDGAYLGYLPGGRWEIGKN